MIKSLPYVYCCIHKETKQVYFGYRERNVKFDRRAEDDLGKYYFTSGVIKKYNFINYDFWVIAEFFDPIDAYWFEQELIKERWGDPLLLNKSFYDKETSKGMFRHTGKTKGFTGRRHTEETKRKMSVPLTEEAKKKISAKVAGKNHPNYGKTLKPETTKKQSIKALERPKFDCFVCGKSMQAGQLARWHNSNCKFLSTVT